MNSNSPHQKMIRPFTPVWVVLMTCTSIAAMWHVWQDIFTVAWRDSEASHIWLVPFVFGWLVWVRRDSLFSLDGNRWIGITLFATGMIFHEVGLNFSIVVLFHLSAVVFLVGGICISCGHKILWRLFPAFVSLLFLVPVPGLIRQQLSLPIQYVSASLVNATFSSVGLPIGQNGFVLSLDGTDILIAEACNGMRMLFAVLLSVYAFCFSLKMNRITRFWILFSIPAIALIVNFLRILATVILFAFAPESWAATFHDLSGWVVPVLLIVAIASFPQENTRSSNAYSDSIYVPHPSQLGIRGFAPSIIALIILGIAYFTNIKSLPDSQAVARHHDQVKQELNEFPYAFGDWVAVEKPLHKEEVDLLKPNAAFRRVYQNMKTSDQITIFAIACRHTRDLVGHEPGICYVAQGWEKSTHETACWETDEEQLCGSQYEFEWTKSDQVPKTQVLCILVAPDGTTTGKSSKLAEFASDYRLERFGAASIQISTHSKLTNEEWHQVTQDFVHAFTTVIHTFKDSRRSFRRNSLLPPALFSYFSFFTE